MVSGSEADSVLYLLCHDALYVHSTAQFSLLLAAVIQWSENSALDKI